MSPKAARQAAAIGKVERPEAGEAPEGFEIGRVGAVAKVEPLETGEALEALNYPSHDMWVVGETPWVSIVTSGTSAPQWIDPSGADANNFRSPEPNQPTLRRAHTAYVIRARLLSPDSATVADRVAELTASAAPATRIGACIIASASPSSGLKLFSGLSRPLVLWFVPDATREC